MPDIEMPPKKTVVIIGGGFSGLAVAANLVEKSIFPMNIFIIEKTPVIGPGIAFGTDESVHPLNVMVENMGLFAENPEGFYAWLQANQPLWRAADSSFKDLKISLRQYLPRKLYGVYLKDIFAKTLEQASKKGTKLEVIHDEAADIEEDFDVRTQSGRRISADVVVLAMSVPTNKSFAFENSQLLANPRYVRNLWEVQGNLPTSGEVAILGSGLTAIDTLWSLQSRGFEGQVHVISRSGKFPQSHAFLESKPMEEYSLQQLPKQCLPLLHFWQSELKKLQHSGGDWRHLVDALRPHSSSLWMSFAYKSKKQFLRRLFPLWNRHRHRMSPDSGSLLGRLMMENKLKIHRGSIAEIVQTADNKLKVQFVSPKDNQMKAVSVDYVINCTGPEYAFKKRQDALMCALSKRGWIKPDDLGLGLKCEQGERVAGANQGKIFTLGSLLFGERFETTSVPDIRVQAASIAKTILG